MKLYSTILALLAAFALCAQQNEELLIELSDPGEIGLLDVSINIGYVEVIGTNRKDVKVSYTISKEDDDEDESDQTKDGLKKIGGGSIHMEVSEHDNEVVIRNGWFNEIELYIEVPKEFDAKIKTSLGGDVMIKDLQGDIEMNSLNGNLTAENISGTMNASTLNGDMKVSFAEVTPDRAMSFTNFNGEIDLALPHDYNAEFKMQTKWSDIYSDFDLVTSKSSPKTKSRDGKMYKVVIDDWTYATLNDGGPEVLIKNYTGGIYLRKN